MSEYEWTLIRQRSHEAIQQKARRGELRIPVPIGFTWTVDGRIEKDPDRRVQHAIDLVFHKMAELGSMRRVLMWFREAQVCLPVVAPHGGASTIIWKLPRYITIRSLLTNPVYAGAYVFGKTETPDHRGGWSCPEKRWSSEAARAVDDLDQRSSPRVSFLGRIRTELRHDEGEHASPFRRRAASRPRRTRVALRSASMPTLWPDDLCGLLGATGRRHSV